MTGLILVLSHLSLALGIIAGGVSGRHIVVREFNNLGFLLVVPMVWWFRKKTLLNINHNITSPLGRGRSALSFRLLSLAGFRFMLLDGERVRDEIERTFKGIRLLTPRFCVTERTAGRGRRRDDGPLRIGVIGDFRAEKGGFGALTGSAKEIAQIPHVALIVGARTPIVSSRACELGLDSRPTGSEQEYDEFLRECDAVLLLATKEHYYMRHSGILIDCVANGIPMIVPSFPIFETMVSIPSRVGVAYRDNADLKRATLELIEHVESLRVNFRGFYSGRRLEHFEAGLHP
jgi:hypothetical protein